MKRYAARIHVSEKELLKWLGFNCGKVHYFGHAAEYYETVIIVVEHPDLPEVLEGGLLPDITPVYQSEILGDRIDPPKTNPLTRLLRKFC